MNKILTFIIICSLSLIYNQAHGNQTNGNHANGKAQNNIIKIAFDSSYYPMTFYNKEHKLMGIDVDIANLVAKRLNLHIQWIERKRHDLIHGLLANQYRMIWSGFAITTNRSKQLLFSNPYYTDSKRIILKFETGKKIKSICGFKVGVQLSSTARRAGLNISCPVHKKIHFILFENNIQAFQDLNKNKIQAIILDTSYGLYYSSKHLKQYRMFPYPLTKAPKGIAFRMEDSTLKNTIDKAITHLRETGKIQRIFKKWTHNDKIY